MIGDIGPMELAIILAVVILVFGAGKVGKLGKELGTSVREFRQAIRDEDDRSATAPVRQYAASASAAPGLEATQTEPRADPRSASTAGSAAPKIF